ncbi:MAG: L,D-transpeptidase family protein [Phycisphaerales bacterium]|nr:L,D-transpeptidase family protein [Phycisphaerales bacterium]
MRCPALLIGTALALAPAFAHAQAPVPAPVLTPERRDNELTHQPARVQTLLARAGFMPGLIDAKPGRKTKIAVEWFQRLHGLDPTGNVDDATLRELEAASAWTPQTPWTRIYVLTDKDVSLITGPIPEDWNERAALELSGYADLEELLAERGWCSVDLLRQLNPDIALSELGVGAEVVLPDVGKGTIPRLASIEVDLAEKLVKGIDAEGRVVFLTHCSIARDVEKRPVGELKVKVVAMDPDYTFDPKVWPDVTNVDKKLRIAPGPRNPVGSAWIGIDRPGYGLHGTVRPQDIGKTGSHGCFRLANWDAIRLARAVKIGMPVLIAE